MAGLIAGYGSSDDETETPSGPSTKSLPALSAEVSFFREDFVDDDEDDKQFQLQAAKDAFGLSREHWQKNEDGTRAKERIELLAAPDVLKEVRLVTSDENAELARIRTELGCRSSPDRRTRS